MDAEAIKKTDQGNQQIAQTASETIIKIGKSRSNHTECKGDCQRELTQPPWQCRSPCQRNENPDVIKNIAVIGIAP